MLVEDKFGDELSYSHHIEKFHDVNLIVQFVSSLLMSLEAIQPTNVAGGLIAETTTTEAEQGGAEVL